MGCCLALILVRPVAPRFDRKTMINYFCPDLLVASAGMRRLYKHVAILNRHGEPAAILHQNACFRAFDMPKVPVKYLSQSAVLTTGDVVVVPEGWPNLLADLSGYPLKLVVIALNWKYIYRSLEKMRDDHQSCGWRDFGVRRAIVASPWIGEMVSWAMRIPVHLVTTGIDPALFRQVPAEQKVRQVVCIARKATDWVELQRLLYSRNPACFESIIWKALDGLSEANYAREVGRSQLFLNLSHAEGFPTALFEARSHALRHARGRLQQRRRAARADCRRPAAELHSQPERRFLHARAAPRAAARRNAA